MMVHAPCPTPTPGPLTPLTTHSLRCHRDTKKSKGTGYVQFRVPEDALKALRELDMTPLQGRLLHVLPAQPSRAAAAEAARKQQEAGCGQVGYGWRCAFISSWSPRVTCTHCIHPCAWAPCRPHADGGSCQPLPFILTSSYHC
jgi:hypothetical protein